MKLNKQGIVPPDFETTAQMLEFARENPQTLRTHWWKYYIVSDLMLTFRLCKQSIILDEDRKEEIIICNKDLTPQCWRPIPCPHFIYPYTLSLVEMLAGKSKTVSQHKHAMIFCIEDAWKLGDDVVFDTISQYFGYTLHDHLVEQAEKHLGAQLPLDAEMDFICNYLSPKFKFAYAKYVVEHAARGLLNKELFK